jgi:formylglycine-generating enzyme required for sulfatase activity
MGAVIDPFARSGNPLARRDRRRMSNHCDEIAVALSLDAQNRKAVFLVVVGHALDETRQAGWLSRLTGREYRLLTEAEWEYAARARTKKYYYWGDDVGRNNANCDRCGSQWGGKQTAPVGSFKPNAFGLYDMTGNVWEWIEDVWHSTYRGAPTDGSAWVQGGDTSRRVIRGGSWGNRPQNLRAACRASGTANLWSSDLGFRVARTLTP